MKGCADYGWDKTRSERSVGSSLALGIHFGRGVINEGKSKTNQLGNGNVGYFVVVECVKDC